MNSNFRVLYVFLIGMAVLSINSGNKLSGQPVVCHYISRGAMDSGRSISAIEMKTLELVNAHRKELNLPALINNEKMANEARQHSLNMAEKKVPFGHKGATQRLKNISHFIKRMQGGGENVFECSEEFEDLPLEAVRNWLDSDGHRENIEGDYNLSGIGVARSAAGDYYFTQIFAKASE